MLCSLITLPLTNLTLPLDKLSNRPPSLRQTVLKLQRIKDWPIRKSGKGRGNENWNWWSIADNKQLTTTNVWQPTSDSWQLMSDNQQLTADDRWLMSDNRQLMTDNWRLTTDVWQLTINGVVSDTWWQMGCRLRTDRCPKMDTILSLSACPVTCTEEHKTGSNYSTSTNQGTLIPVTICMFMSIRAALGEEQSRPRHADSCLEEGRKSL